ncbi:MAG: Nif3-like dinuclear metal center hexameric protein [Eubacteriales bacterium]
MIASELIGKLEELAPCNYAYSWDNVGLLVGREDKPVKRVLLALDATEEMVEQAIADEVDMIITHHPLVFSGMKQVTTSDYIQRRVYKLIQHDICCYAMHTNFDVMGMADAMADELSLQERKVLDVTYEDAIATEGCGRYGTLERSYSLGEYAMEVKKRLQLEHILVYGPLDSLVESVAIMPGSGASMIHKALAASVDVMITGDMKHHEGMDAVAQGLGIIDAGHYGTEKIFVPYMKEYLRRNAPELVVKAPYQGNPFKVL